MLWALLSLSKCQLVFITFFSPHAKNLKIIENIFFVKNRVNLEKCWSHWRRCYNLFGPIFYLQDSARKQIEQLPLLCSLLGNWCSSLNYTMQARSRSNILELVVSLNIKTGENQQGVVSVSLFFFFFFRMLTSTKKHSRLSFIL